MLPNLKSLGDRSFQADVERVFNQGFPAREALIRLSNELSLRIFGNTALNPTAFVVGKENALFDAAYLKEYFIRRVEERKIEEWVGGVAKLQSLCKSRSTAFILLITPTKVTISPQWIPDAWRGRLNPKPRPYELLIKLLEKYKINYVDGNVITKRARDSGLLKTTAFPLGGIHWTDEAALHTANAVLENLRDQGLNVQNIDVGSIRVNTHPEGDAADMLRTMNFALPWSYPYPLVDVTPRKEISRRYVISGVGGSFWFQIANLLSRTGQFFEIDYFFYLTAGKNNWMNGTFAIAREPSGIINLEREILSADAVVLEVNDNHVREAKHIKQFLKLVSKWEEKEKPQERTKNFAYEGYLLCHPGATVPVTMVYSGINGARALSGFSHNPGPGATAYSYSSSVRVRWMGPQGAPLQLRAVSGISLDANVDDRARVSVKANGMEIAVWDYAALENLTERKALIPANAIGPEGEIEFEFTILPSAGWLAAHLRFSLSSIELSTAEHAGAGKPALPSSVEE